MGAVSGMWSTRRSETGVSVPYLANAHPCIQELAPPHDQMGLPRVKPRAYDPPRLPFGLAFALLSIAAALRRSSRIFARSWRIADRSSGVNCAQYSRARLDWTLCASWRCQRRPTSDCAALLFRDFAIGSWAL